MAQVEVDTLMTIPHIRLLFQMKSLSPEEEIIDQQKYFNTVHHIKKKTKNRSDDAKPTKLEF